MPDLHTNLVLNDKQFADGLRRAEGGLGAFTSRVKGFSQTMNTAFKLAGAATVIGSVVNGVLKYAEAQDRVNRGVATFEEKWTQSSGAIASIVTELPVIGSWIDRIDRRLGDFDKLKLEFEGQKEASVFTKAIERQYELATAGNDEQKQLISLKHTEQDVLEQIRQTAQKTNDSYDDIIKKQMRLLDLAYERSRLEKAVSEYTQLQSQYRQEFYQREDRRSANDQSQTSFYDMVEREQIAALRRAGLESEAGERQRADERRRRLRDIQRDETLFDRPAEAARRRQIVDLLGQLDTQAENSYRQTVSTSAVGSAALLGQTFAVGAMNDQKREQKRMSDNVQIIVTQLNRLVSQRQNPSLYN
jgi:hypothetical protein